MCVCVCYISHIYITMSVHTNLYLYSVKIRKYITSTCIDYKVRDMMISLYYNLFTD